MPARESCRPPDTLITPTRPGGRRAASASAAAPPADTPAAMTRRGSASGRRAITASAAARSSALRSKLSRKFWRTQSTPGGSRPSDSPKPRRTMTTASQPRWAKSRAWGRWSLARFLAFSSAEELRPWVISAIGSRPVAPAGFTTMASSRYGRPSICTERKVLSSISAWAEAEASPARNAATSAAHAMIPRPTDPSLR